MLSMKKGAFIVIDGIDGSGKSTQVKLLREKFPRALITHDPGGTEAGEMIRSVVLGAKTLSPLATFFLFLASRAALVEQKITPALKRGRTVICDRFDSSMYAYQVHAGKHPEYLKLVNAFAGEVLKKAVPDVYVILDSDPKKAHTRLFGARGKKLNAYDRKPLSYHRRVREGFKRFKPKGSKVYFVNADRTPEEVFEDVLAVVNNFVK